MLKWSVIHSFPLALISVQFRTVLTISFCCHNLGKAKWVREEALASIVAIEMIDLPLADFEGSIQSELQNKDGKLIGEGSCKIFSIFSKHSFNFYMQFSRGKLRQL